MGYTLFFSIRCEYAIVMMNGTVMTHDKKAHLLFFFLYLQILCVEAKNFNAGNDTGSKVAACVIELQRRCPNARVVYCSATGISEIGNMAYMQRLGFWGAGTPFADADRFITAMKNRGVGFLEMLVRKGSIRGIYCIRYHYDMLPASSWSRFILLSYEYDMISTQRKSCFCWRRLTQKSLVCPLLRLFHCCTATWSDGVCLYKSTLALPCSSGPDGVRMTQSTRLDSCGVRATRGESTKRI